MEHMHRLLERQLKQHFGDNFTIPWEWVEFVNATNMVYRKCVTDNGAVKSSSDLNWETSAIQERLRLEEQLSKLAATAPGVIHAFRRRADGTACFPYANPSIENIYGCKPEVLVDDATPVWKCIHPDDLPRLNASVEKSALNMSLWREEFRVHHPQKGLIWVVNVNGSVLSIDTNYPLDRMRALWPGNCGWNMRGRFIT